MPVNIAKLKKATRAQLLDAVLAESDRFNGLRDALAETIGDLRQLGWESASHKDKLVFLSLARRLQDIYDS